MANEVDAVKARVREQFGRTAAGYVTSAGHAGGDDLARLAALAAPSADDVALDIATGGGHTALAVARAGAGTVVASDFTANMLRTARGFIEKSDVAGVRFALADAEALPFADRSFSLVTTRIAPHHFPNPAQYVREVARVLLPGGRFLLEDSVVPEGPAGDFLNYVEKLRDGSHGRTLPLAEWVALLQDAEFTVESVELFRKTHELTQWIGRSGANEAEVRDAWNAAPVEARDAFETEHDPETNAIVSYSDDKALIYATKPLATS